VMGLKSLQVVLADGSIVNANAQQSSDLFWALKGGGPNYGMWSFLYNTQNSDWNNAGIVTKFDLNTIPIKNIWYQLNVHSVDQAPALLEAFATWQKDPDNKGSVAMIISLTSIVVGLIYSRPVEKPETFKSFYGITPLAAVVPSTLGTVQQLNLLGGSSSTAAPAPR
jgi:FAD/FMN-containing dehydrogenase